jgi:hypothetical protein
MASEVGMTLRSELGHSSMEHATAVAASLGSSLSTTGKVGIGVLTVAMHYGLKAVGEEATGS